MCSACSLICNIPFYAVDHKDIPYSQFLPHTWPPKDNLGFDEVRMLHRQGYLGDIDATGGVITHGERVRVHSFFFFSSILDVLSRTTA